MWGYHLRFVALPRELWVVNIHGYDTNTVLLQNTDWLVQ
jgi:hypothetical protein